MDLDSKLLQLQNMHDNLEVLENEARKDPNNNLIRRNIILFKAAEKKLSGEVEILKKIADLDNKYRNHEPINFTYNGGSYFDDISLSFNDVNYDLAYKQQKQLLELELAHYNGTVIGGYDYGTSDYESAYQKNKESLLNTKIDTSPKKDVSKKKEDGNKDLVGMRFKRNADGSNVMSNSNGGGKHFKNADSNVVENTTSYNPYIGGKHFKANQLDSPYVVFVKDGNGYVVGNFTSDFLNKNFALLDSKLLNENIKKVRLINDLEFGTNNIDGIDNQIKVTKDGDVEILGDVDMIEHHNSLDEKENDKENVAEKENLGIVKISDDGPIKDNSGLDVLPNPADYMDDSKDMSGLDKIVDIPEAIDLSQGAESIEPVVPGKKVSRRKVIPSLVEKWKGLKTWQKAAIVAGVIAVVGVGVSIAFGPQIMDGVNHLLNPENANTVNNAVSTVQDTMANTSNAAASLDYSGIGEGQTVFTNAYDAASNANGVVSNEWFSNNPLDVFNTATNSYMGLTPEQLNDPSFMAELAKDPNNALLFGNSMADPSGFVGLDDVVDTVTKIR